MYVVCGGTPPAVKMRRRSMNCPVVNSESRLSAQVDDIRRQTYQNNNSLKRIHWNRNRRKLVDSARTRHWPCVSPQIVTGTGTSIRVSWLSKISEAQPATLMHSSAVMAQNGSLVAFIVHKRSRTSIRYSSLYRKNCVGRVSLDWLSEANAPTITRDLCCFYIHVDVADNNLTSSPLVWNSFRVFDMPPRSFRMETVQDIRVPRSKQSAVRDRGKPTSSSWSWGDGNNNT